MAPLISDTLQQLQYHLDQQIQRVRRNNWRGFASAQPHIEALIKEMTTNPHLQEPVPAQQKEQLVRTYQQLLLMIDSHKQITEEQLKKIRKGKKTVQTYRHV